MDGKVVLIGWELGGNQGHLARITHVARELAADGWTPVVASSNIAAARTVLPPDIPVWQSPLWPVQLAATPRPPMRQVLSMASILEQMGIAAPQATAAVVASWLDIIAAVRPGAIVADFAPGLCMAARTRLPIIGVGTGFTRTPVGLTHFPTVNGSPVDTAAEERLAERVSEQLTGIGEKPLVRLTDAMACDASIVCTFAELDPYNDARRETYSPPTIGQAVPRPTTSLGDGVFVYSHGSVDAGMPLWSALAGSRRNVTIHIHQPTRRHREVVAQIGAKLLDKPASAEEIAATSALAISHGGLGFVSAMLLAGVPQIALHYDLEKYGTARSLACAGLGIGAALASNDAESLQALIRRALDDRALAERAIGHAPSFGERMRQGPDVAGAIRALVG